MRGGQRQRHARAGARAARGGKERLLQLSRPDLPRARTPAAAAPKTGGRGRIGGGVVATLFGSDLWKPALDKYAEATGLSVELFGADGRVVLNSMYATPLVGLFREYRFEPGLFAECARRCLNQTYAR